MSVVVTREDGQFLDQQRGQHRTWTKDLAAAGVFETAGKAKVAWNHATAFNRKHYPERVQAVMTWEVEVISRNDVHALRQAAEKLAALEAAGVDNWEGYSEAMRMLRREDGE